MQQAHIPEKLITLLNQEVVPFRISDESSYDGLIEDVGNSRFVLIGEATHGTQEFYQVRAEITRQLIMKKGFMAVGIEGDWPDAYRIHRYVQGKLEEDKWEEALQGFKRFPTWMWRNSILPPFMKWLRSHNKSLAITKRVGFYGLDLYSLHSSIHSVIHYLNKVDPQGAEEARKRYACFDHCKIDPQTYGLLTKIGKKKACIKEAMEQLLEMQNHALEYAHKDGINAEEEYFYATQNARLVKNAENYYRVMFEGRASSWNIRDRHMVETLNILIDHLENRFQSPAKVIVWAHNSHVGDARATEMSESGEVNIGQLMREQSEDTYLIGFSTYQGTVTAASDWDRPPEKKQVSKGMHGSYEELFHQVKPKNFMLRLSGNEDKQD